MNIVLIGTLPEAERDHHRGPERVTIGLADSLTATGHDVTVLADEGDSETTAAEAKILTPTASPGIGRLIKFWRAVDRQLNGTADIVHSWRPAPDVDVLSLHSVGQAGTGAGMEKPDIRTRIGAWIERRAKHAVGRSANRVVMTAPKNMAEAAANRFSPDACLPVGCHDGFLSENIESGQSSPRVLMVGRVEPAKQQDFVATATPDDHDLVFVGPIGNQGFATKIEDNSELTGELSEEVLQTEYQRADIVVVPSRHEGFSLTAVEAMAAETPVVVSDGCGIADIVRQHQAGAVFSVNHKRSYRRALDFALSNRNRMARSAKSLVKAELTWSVIAQQYLQLYEEVLSEPTAE